jgi:NADH-quinone oxidoreductase subunit L
LYQWFILDIYVINIGLLFDTLSSSMIVVVTTISMFVHLYSTGYMSHDPHYQDLWVIYLYLHFLCWF